MAELSLTSFGAGLGGAVDIVLQKLGVPSPHIDFQTNAPSNSATAWFKCPMTINGKFKDGEVTLQMSASLTDGSALIYSAIPTLPTGLTILTEIVPDLADKLINKLRYETDNTIEIVGANATFLLDRLTNWFNSIGTPNESVFLEGAAALIYAALTQVVDNIHNIISTDLIDIRKEVAAKAYSELGGKE